MTEILQEPCMEAPTVFMTQYVERMDCDGAPDEVRWERVMELRAAIAAETYRVPASAICDALVLRVRVRS